MLLERQNELSTAAEALRFAAQGNGSLVVISGPPGIGRSALLTEIGELADRSPADAATTRRPLVMRAYAAPAERGFPFGVARQLLEPALKSAPGRWTSGPARPAPAFLTADPEPPQQHGATTVRALLALVENMSHDRTPVLLVDDLHWADAASLDWLDQLVQHAAHWGVLVAVTMCEGESDAAPAPGTAIAAAAEHTLLPAPLGTAAVHELILEHLGLPADPQFTNACHDAARGNPLYLMSLLRQCQADGVAPVAADAPAVATLVPPALRRRLLLCLREQSPAVLAVARALMVLGDDAEPQVVGELAGLDPVDLDDSLRRLRRLALLGRDDPLRLAHRAVHEVVDEATPPSERNRLHVRSAALLHYRGCPPERVAGHLLAATVPLDDGAVATLRRAAEAAVLRGDPEAAARCLRRALRDSAPYSEERAGLLVELATVERSFAPSVAVRHVTQAYPLLSGPAVRAEALLALTPMAPGATLLSSADLVRQTARQLGDPRELPPAQRPQALRLQARLHYLSENDPAALASAVDRLAGLGESPEAGRGEQRELLAALLHAATVTVGVRADRAGALARRVMDHEPATAAHVHTLVPLVVPVALAADSVAGLLPWLDTALADAVRRGGRLEQSVILSEQALVLLAEGLLDAARERAVRACSVVGPDEMSTLSAIALVMVALRTREPELVTSLPDRLRAFEDNCELAAVRTLVRGMEAEQRQEPAVALEHFLESGYAMERAGWTNPVLAPSAYWAARMLHRMGESARAEELCERHVERARLWGAPAALGRALALRATVRGGSPGVLREAAAVLEESADLRTRASVLVRLAEAVAARHPAEAEAALRTAYELAVRCGASQIAARAQELLGPRTVGAPARTHLTSAEGLVARMAVRGLTNQAIADALGVSRRAVEKHLTSCYRKMSASGRSGLAAALEDAGLFDSADAPEPPSAGEEQPQGAA
ncbi:ATP-binding protein [Streptomyces graminilatus]|uniref:ATP-binding protein n=1 Tax=Streptomyces graminilatus TaxID=1464070 RepID=UPI0006E4127D|nr:LuxR family transcriptional regulator [Streptomyces graminilatus]